MQAKCIFWGQARDNRHFADSNTARAINAVACHAERYLSSRKNIILLTHFSPQIVHFFSVPANTIAMSLVSNISNNKTTNIHKWWVRSAKKQITFEYFAPGKVVPQQFRQSYIPGRAHVIIFMIK